MEKNAKGTKLEFQIELEYFNTSSHKHLLRMLKIIKELNEESMTVWNYDEEDEEMLEIGKKMEILSGLTFSFVTTD